MGRPKLPSHVKKRARAVSLSDTQNERFQALGGSPWLQGVLERGVDVTVQIASMAPREETSSVVLRVNGRLYGPYQAGDSVRIEAQAPVDPEVHGLALRVGSPELKAAQHTINRRRSAALVAMHAKARKA
jgi:hypothetical protein